MKGAWKAEEVGVNEWTGIIGIIVAILIPAVSGIILIVIKLSSRVSKNETNIENIQKILEKQATQEGLKSLSDKIDLFYKLVTDTANQLVSKHADQVTEYRKSIISMNSTMDRLEKQNKEMEKELEALRKK